MTMNLSDFIFLICGAVVSNKK